MKRPLALLCVLVVAAGCQGWDRLEPDRAASDAGDNRGSLIDATSAPEFGSGGRLTNDIATRWIRQIEAAPSEQRLELAAQFLREYPSADVIWQLHEMVGTAQSELGDPAAAAQAWERAIEMSWPEPDLLGLPLSELDLPYQVGWARFESGEVEAGADWLVRATFISDRPQLEQGLRFLYAELGAPGDDFDAWLESRRSEMALQAPDFELPGYQSDSLKLSENGARLTLVNFWTPT